MDSMFPEARSLERLLYHLTPRQAAMIFVMLEVNHIHKNDRDWAGDLAPMAEEHEQMMNRVRAYVVGDGRGDFDSVLVPEARSAMENAALTLRRQKGNLRKTKSR